MSGPVTGPADGAPATAPDGVDPAFARSVRFWARAYPRRWRQARGAELLGLLADLAAPDARRLDARSAVDLVRAGWATRLREHPPLGPWLLYRLVDRRLLGHLPWVRDDIDGAGYPLRPVAPVVVFLLVTAVGNVGEPVWAVVDARTLAIFVGTWLAAMTVMAPRLRRQARERHLVPNPGEPVRPGAFVRAPAQRRRLSARAGLPWLVGGLAAVLVASTLAVARARTTLQVEWLPPEEGFGTSVEPGGAVPRAAILAALAVGVAVGLLLALRARRQVRALPSVAQPHRVLVGAGPRTVLVALLAVGAAVAVPVGEALGTFSLVLSVPLGLAAGVLAPPLTVAWGVLRRSPVRDDLALVDAWHATWSRDPLRPDEPRSEPVPADPALVGVVQPWPYSNEGPTAALG